MTTNNEIDNNSKDIYTKMLFHLSWIIKTVQTFLHLTEQYR